MHHTLAQTFGPMRILTASLLVIALGAGCGGNEVGDTPVSRCVPEGACPDDILASGIRASLGDPAKGATVFNVNCARCHGETGLGIADARRIDMSSPAWQASMKDAGIVATVRAGRGTLMPAFNLDDDALRDLLAHVRNLVREGATPQPGVESPQPAEPNRGGY